MSNGSTEEVRARLQDELRKLLISAIESNGQATDTLVAKIVSQLQPQLQQHLAVSLDEQQVQQLAKSIAEATPKDKKTNEKPGLLPQFGQLGGLINAVLMALGIAMLVIGTTLSIGGSRKDPSVDTHQAAPADNVARDETREPNELVWRKTVSRLVEDHNAFYRQHSTLICGANRPVLDCQDYAAAQGKWAAITGDKLTELKLLQETITAARECSPLNIAAAITPTASDYVVAIDNCLMPPQAAN
ncbi:MAG: hypothetical protein V4475_11880 [Pseudomonadota bacterium]